MPSYSFTKKHVKQCRFCGAPYTAKLDNAMYCSSLCRERARRKRNPRNKQTLAPEVYLATLERNRKTAALRRKLDPSKHRARKARRKALLMGAIIGDLSRISGWMKSWQTKPSALCYWCGKRSRVSKCDADHITPLVLGGAHDLSNLCISCQSCNRSKCALDIKDWNKKLLQPVLL